MKKITPENLYPCFNGGTPNAKQLAMFGMRWPLESGWAKKMIGKEVEDGFLDRLAALRKKKARDVSPTLVIRKVVSAAMKMKDGLIVAGVRHFSPDMRAVLHRIYGEGYHLKVEEQGFIDTHGNFLSREQAWLNADYHGQIHTYAPVGETKIRRKARRGDTGTLFSENLY
jgi:hypothetical protein